MPDTDKKIPTINIEEKTSEKPDKKSTSTQTAIDSIREKFGEGAIMRFGDAKTMEVEFVPTGCLSMDIALGIGGVPRGRVIELYGSESSGKTTLAQHIVKEVQKLGGTAAFVDAEHALDPAYAKKIGVNVNELLVSQPDSGEQALEIVETLVRSNSVDVIIIDSVAALTPRAEIEGEMGDRHVALQARLMSQALRKLTSIIAKTKTCVVFINQTRQKIGVFFGNPNTTPGGMALKFYSSVRIDLTRAAQIKMADRTIGNRVKAKIVKNKVAPPFKTAEFDIMYNEGISLAGDVLDLGMKNSLIKKTGTTFTYKSPKEDAEEIKLGAGRENAKKFLKSEPKLMKEISKLIWNKVREEEK